MSLQLQHKCLLANTAAVQTCLLVECCCKMDACWTAATQSACLLTFVTHYCISAGVVLLHVLYLLVWCLTISCACWCGASYRSYLLVWYITISHACWCGASLEVMPSYVVPHCRSCLLVWCLIKCHACWRDTSL